MGRSEVPGSKKAKREQDEITRLEREIRELKSINRSLMKQLKKLAKGIHKEEIEEALDSLETKKEEVEVNKHKKCPNCARSSLIETDINGRIFQNCPICEYKSGLIRRK